MDLVTDQTGGTDGDVPILDRAAALNRLGGDLEFWIELVELLLEDSAGRLERIDSAMAGGDLLAVSREAHSIKGAAANVDAPRVKEEALRLERSAAGEDRTAAEDAYQSMRSALEDVRGELGRLSG